MWGLRLFVPQVHRGIKGVVRDKLTKQGLADAVIKVEDHEHDIRSGEAAGFVRWFLVTEAVEEQSVQSSLSPAFSLNNDSSPVAADGDYWRLLNPGEYKVVVRAEGYFPAMRRCHVGMEPRPTICDFSLTQTPIQRLKDIRAKGGKIPQDLQLRLRALRLRKLRASTKAINRRRESQRLQTRTARRS